MFNQFCKKTGIERHKTTPRNPQQNGLAERMNRTILERVRCMLIYSGLPKNFWAEAAVTACYLINRCPSSAIKFKTPLEVWKGGNSSYEHLRIFGCLAYAHKIQDKLEPRAKKCVFLGYPEGVKGYKLWNLEDQKNIISRDVIFDEKTMYKDLSKHGEKKKVSSSDTLYESQFEVELDESDKQKGGTMPEIEEEEGLLEEHVNDDAEEESQEYLLVRDRKKRVIKPPSRF